MTILTMDYTSKEYIGLIIEIKDSEYVKSISDVHLTFTQMPLVEPGINNLALDYTIKLNNVAYDADTEDYSYIAVVDPKDIITRDVQDGGQLVLPLLIPITDTAAAKDYGIHTGWLTANNGSFISGNLYDKDADGFEFYPTWTFEFKYDLTGTELLMEQLIDLRDANSGKPFTVSINGVTYDSTISDPAEGAFETIDADIVKTGIVSGPTWINSPAYVEITAYVGDLSFTMEYDWNNQPIGPGVCSTYVVPTNLSVFINDVGIALNSVSVET
jgi:hypothetical protein